MPPPYCRLAEHADMRSSLSSGFQDVTVAAFACEMGYSDGRGRANHSMNICISIIPERLLIYITKI
jgi:hypothetical protein